MQDHTLPPDQLEAGTPAYRRANFAVFLGGFACFAMLYGTQPLLPLLAETFAVSPTHASLSVSYGTGALALALIPASLLSDRFGRLALMRIALALAAMLAMTCAFARSFDELLLLRALLGVTLAGLPAAAMAYLGEEIAPSAQGRAMGLYIAGNAFGGMSGRFMAAAITDLSNWRVALFVIGVVGAAAAFAFFFALPASRHFRRRSIRLQAVGRDAAALFSDAGLPWLFLCAFLLMGAFVALYNFLTFRLVAPPFSLGQTAIGGIFLLYLVGTWASAWAGQLADRIGRRNVLWMMVCLMLAGVGLTWLSWLPALIAGVALFTLGYFGAHTTCSGWVGRRAGARRALAAAIYLSSYYLGSSILGSTVGLAWDAGQWAAVASVLMGLCAVVLGVAMHLRRIPRVGQSVTTRNTATALGAGCRS
ncbi:MFS transporter [Nitrogeniibacter mangrovi]|uniref:MFS transporter n=1 Tax=Nitrogeniibacter mangrovi TaxID=2016596 RepID=A0A6C1B3S9_9RHOO|nr:MFS transporter [Nitrogeniibacter mangrovi]QID18207.1 MFS transporter [Nitrogeniibacter mangrovi]